MPADIAVFVGENGRTASLYEKGKIVLYTKTSGKWKVQKEKHFFLEKSFGMRELRNKMEEVKSFLPQGCNIFVGLQITGLPYFELEKSNFSVWEIEGTPCQFLDHVLEKEEENGLQTRVNKGKLPVPQEISSGCYRISIKEIQGKNTGFTSKQALLPFLKKGLFYSLEIICSHIPPWLETELINSRLFWEVRTISRNEMSVTINKRCCG
ncbi:MAG: nitrogenase [Peptococcaceae bacterium BRH_c4a]|nr:MAG: nitrogenase [Peptococcaceae bacterium BRH_c4a]